MCTLCAKLKIAYFQSVVAILKDAFAVNDNSRPTYRASISSSSPKTHDYSVTSLGCELHVHAKLKLLPLFVLRIYFRCEYYCC